jgi:hypothetical protein
MSSRSLRALRGNIHEIKPIESDDDDESDDEEEEERLVRPSAFTAMMDSDDDDEEEESEEDEEVKDSSNKDEADTKEDAPSQSAKAAVQPSPKPVEKQKVKVDEDIDAILEEFRMQDDGRMEHTDSDQYSTESPFSCLTKGLDFKALDMEYSMRTSLLGTEGTSDAQRTRKGRSTFLFGPAKDDWSRPPNYIGGGIGMTTYDREDISVPWPYNDNTVLDEQVFKEMSDPKKWFTFMHSDIFDELLDDYDTVQSSGDLNLLVMFVAHHPFVTDALLQLSTVCYQTNHSQEGLAFLRRCLWIYECSSLLHFNKSLESGAYMDADGAENQPYFRALTQLIQVSRIAGYVFL